MQAQSITNLKIQDPAGVATDSAIDGREFEQLVGAGLLEDMNQQLSDISYKMEQELVQKQGIRKEIESLYQMEQGKKVIKVNGNQYIDVSPEDAILLGISGDAIPSTDSDGKVTSYRITKEQFDEAIKSGIYLRDEQLKEMNSNNELTMIQIQSLVDQRKNLLNLLSNLMASANSVAQNIIQNIRG